MKIFFPQYWERDSCLVQSENCYTSFESALKAVEDDVNGIRSMCDNGARSTINYVERDEDGGGTIHMLFGDSGKPNTYNTIDIICMTVEDVNG